MQSQNEPNHIKIIPVGDLFQSDMQTWVNPINCKGTMGAGLAERFKNRFPDVFKEYQALCLQGKVKPGEPYLSDKTGSSIRVLNFPTKNNWRHKSDLNFVRAGLEHLVQHAKAWGITSLAIPALGCGLGGLKWTEVLPVMLEILTPLDIPIQIFQEGPQLEITATAKNPKRKPKESDSRANTVITESFFSKKRRKGKNTEQQTLLPSLK